MAIGDPYASLADLKKYMAGTLQGASQYDDVLEWALESTSREIESYCARQFNRAEGASPRVYAPSAGGCRVLVDDFWTTDDLVVEVDPTGAWSSSTVWPPDRYRLEPINGVRDGMPGWPYYVIRAVGGWSFPSGATVRVTARWGWAQVPEPVRQACLILAAETFQLKDAPFGVAGLDATGSVVRIQHNKMAARKLTPYRRDVVMVA